MFSKELPLINVSPLPGMFPFREMAKTMNTCRIYNVYDVIGQVVPEDSAFWDIRPPCCWDLAVIGRWKIGEPGREIPKYRCFPPLAFPNWGERETPPRPFVIPGKSSEQFVQQCTWDAFPRAGATWPCIYSPTALVVVNGEPFPGEEMTLRVCSCTAEKDCCRLVLVGQSVLQHSVGLRRWMRFPNRRLWRQTHCITVLVSLCLSQCCFPMCCFFLAGFPALAN